MTNYGALDVEQARALIASLSEEHLMMIYGGVGVAALLFAWWWIAGRRTRKLPCRWRKERHGHRGNLVKWTCRSCSVQAYSVARKGPAECKQPLRERPL